MTNVQTKVGKLHPSVATAPPAGGLFQAVRLLPVGGRSWGEVSAPQTAPPGGGRLKAGGEGAAGFRPAPGRHGGLL